jgi:hypothetical protein
MTVSTVPRSRWRSHASASPHDLALGRAVSAAGVGADRRQERGARRRPRARRHGARRLAHAGDATAITSCIRATSQTPSASSIVVSSSTTSDHTTFDGVPGGGILPAPFFSRRAPITSRAWKTRSVTGATNFPAGAMPWQRSCLTFQPR